jgi:glycosyltransferase involved in cell wall biosynthesis
LEEQRVVKTVSIVVPCRNEEKFIAQCIEGFMEQSYPKELFEVLICDGLSEDRTREIVKEYEKKYDNVRLLDNPGKTAPKAMNIGIKYSDKDVIIIFGAHSIPDVDFVRGNMEVLNRTPAGCVGGTMKTINDSLKGDAIAKAMSSPFGVGNALFRYATKETYVDTVAFGGYRREMLDKIGYFDEELVRNQDDEINFRVIKAGYKILLSPEIKSTYYSRGSFRKLWKQYYQYGFWKVRVMQKHGKPAALRHLVPMIFVLTNILGIVGSLFSTFILYLWLLELLTYTACALGMSLKLSKENRKMIKYLPLTFPILHASYGLGFLEGLAVFYILKNSKSVDKNTKMSR